MWNNFLATSAYYIFVSPETHMVQGRQLTPFHAPYEILIKLRTYVYVNRFHKQTLSSYEAICWPLKYTAIYHKTFLSACLSF
jgi:hypothetical protein